jgi:hypothetical protein
MRIQILLLFTLFLFFGCKQQKCEIPAEIANIKVEMKAQRLEQELFQARSKEEVAAFIK